MRPWHYVVLAVVILLVFGAGKLPDIAKSIGQSLKVFKKEVRELQEEPPATAAPPPAASSGGSLPEAAGGPAAPGDPPAT